jgi:hypothetical protein
MYQINSYNKYGDWQYLIADCKTLQEAKDYVAKTLASEDDDGDPWDYLITDKQGELV